MENLVNITLRESDYQSMLLNGAFIGRKMISTKVMPNDETLKNDEIYQKLVKDYKKCRDKMVEYRFNKLTNK